MQEYALLAFYGYELIFITCQTKSFLHGAIKTKPKIMQILTDG